MLCTAIVFWLRSWQYENQGWQRCFCFINSSMFTYSSIWFCPRSPFAVCGIWLFHDFHYILYESSAAEAELQYIQGLHHSTSLWQIFGYQACTCKVWTLVCHYNFSSSPTFGSCGLPSGLCFVVVFLFSCISHAQGSWCPSLLLIHSSQLLISTPNL